MWQSVKKIPVSGAPPQFPNIQKCGSSVKIEGKKTKKWENVRERHVSGGQFRPLPNNRRPTYTTIIAESIEVINILQMIVIVIICESRHNHCYRQAKPQSWCRDGVSQIDKEHDRLRGASHRGASEASQRG